jgi:hypothetical protein
LTTLTERSSDRLARRLLLVAAVLSLWAAAINRTGGFFLDFGIFHFSARGIRNPLIGAALCIVSAWAIGPPGRRWRSLAENWASLGHAVDAAIVSRDSRVVRRATDCLVAAIGIAVIVIGVRIGALVAGGSDSYGYVSQARLWATGTLRVPLPLDGDLPDNLEYHAFTPLGYRLANDGRSSVPTYAPGFPMLMAVFEWVGGPEAGFYVMPILAGVTVWATYLLGIVVAGRTVGLLAALLMATSPPFLFQLTHAPMSDIVAAGWWTLTLVLLQGPSRASSLLMGLCAAAAILTRPNLVALAMVPAVALLWDVVATRGARRQSNVRLALYCIGPAVAGLFIAWLNTYWYGSATTSGYGALGGELFQWAFVQQNLNNYSRSLVAAQTPAIIAAVAGPWLVWRYRSAAGATPVSQSVLVAYVLFVIVMYLCYAAYLPMEAWWGLRFFLPAFPVVMVFMSAALIRGAALLPVPRVVWPLIIVTLIFSQTHLFIRDTYALDSRGEWRFANIGRYVAETLPARAVVFTVLHAGSVSYYSGRIAVRFDAVQPAHFKAIVEEFQRRGYAVYILLDEFEREQFTQQFGAATNWGRLDARAAQLVPYVKLYEVF